MEFKAQILLAPPPIVCAGACRLEGLNILLEIRVDRYSRRPRYPVTKQTGNFMHAQSSINL